MREFALIIVLSVTPVYAYLGYYLWHTLARLFPVQNVWVDALTFLAGLWTAVVISALIRRQISE